MASHRILYTLSSAVQGAIVAYPIGFGRQIGGPTSRRTISHGKSRVSRHLSSLRNIVSGRHLRSGRCDESERGQPRCGHGHGFGRKIPFRGDGVRGRHLHHRSPNSRRSQPRQSLDSVGVAVFAIGANATLTQVPGSPFALPAEPGGQAPSASALAVTPMVYPIQYSACSSNAALTTENLYVTDSVNYVVVNFSVNPSTGFLTLVPTASIAGHCDGHSAHGRGG